MDPADPRSARHVGSKRPASRSPEGNASPRKFSRNVYSSIRDGASTPLAQEESRQKSIAGSSRSTPQPLVVRTDEAAPSIPTGSGAELQVTDGADDKMTPEVMKELIDHLKEASALRVRRDVCAAKQHVAYREHEKMKVHFQKFPPLREKAEKYRKEADEELAQLDRFIETNEQAQETISTKFWRELSESMNGKLGDLAGEFVAQSSKHMNAKFVGRDRFEALEQKHELLLRRLDSQQESIEKMQKDRSSFDAKTLLTSLARDEGFVSRADYNAIEKQYTKLESDLETQKMRSVELQRQLSDAKKVSDSSSKATTANALMIEQITGQISTLQSRGDRFDSSVQTVQTRMDGTVKQMKSIQDIANAASSSAQSATALAEKVPALEGRMKGAEESSARIGEWTDKVVKLGQVIDAVKKASGLDTQRITALDEELKEDRKSFNNRIKELAQEVLKLKFGSRSSPGPTTPSSPKPDLFPRKMVPDPARNVDSFIQDLTRLKSDVATLQGVIYGQGGADDDDDIHIQGLSKRLILMEREFSETDAKVNEEGKPSVVKRLEKHDQMINNLWADVKGDDDAPIARRIRMVEDDLRRVESEVRDQGIGSTRASTVSGQGSPGRNPDQAALVAKIAELTERVDAIVNVELAAIKDDAEPRDQILQRFVEEKVDAVAQQLSTLDATFSERLESNKTELKSLTKQVDALQHIFDAGPKSSDVDFLKAELRNLATSVETLESREVAAPAQASHSGPPQFKPLSARGSPAVQSPHAAASHINGNGIGPPPFRPVTVNGASAIGNGASQELRDELESLKNGHLGLAMALKQLQFRADNLSTEDVVKAMCSQMSEIYPAAKDFQGSIDRLTAKDLSLEQRLNSISAIGDNTAQDLKKLDSHLANITRSARVWEAARQRTDANGVAIDSLRDKISTLHDKTAELEERGPAPVSQQTGIDKAALTVLENKVKDVKEHLTQVEDHVRAFQAKETADDETINELRKALDKARTELDGLLKERDDFESSLLAINTKLESVDEKLGEADTRLGTVDETLTAQQDQIGVCQSQIRALEDTYEE